VGQIVQGEMSGVFGLPRDGAIVASALKHSRTIQLFRNLNPQDHIPRLAKEAKAQGSSVRVP
jgi:hypothetical protein